jgi:hypothetical protein
MHGEVVFECGEVQVPATVPSRKLYVIFEIDGYITEDWFRAISGEWIARKSNDHTLADNWKIS